VMQVNDWLHEKIIELDAAVAEHWADGKGMGAHYRADQMAEAAAYREATDAIRTLTGKLAPVHTVDGTRFTAEHELCDLLLNASVPLWYRHQLTLIAEEA
jgi:hypothetical protein